MGALRRPFEFVNFASLLDYIIPCLGGVTQCLKGFVLLGLVVKLNRVRMVM